MKETAVQWLVKQIENDSDTIFYDRNLHSFEKYVEQAKAMEKEQIIDAYYQIGKDHQDMIFPIEKNAEQYYKETYESNY